MSVTRSAGTPITVGRVSFLVGGGYRGETPELDAAVVKAADMLQNVFKSSDVQIRFNSNGLSGGAFIGHDWHDFGLCANLYNVKPAAMTDDEWWASPFEFMRAQPRTLGIYTYVDTRYLVNPDDANSGNPDHRYSHERHNSLEAGLAWLVAHVKVIQEE